VNVEAEAAAAIRGVVVVGVIEAYLQDVWSI
jgi:hypothetical protein